MKRLVFSELQRIIKSKRNKFLLAFYIILILANCAFRFICPQGTYDGKNYNVILNSLNFSPFVFYEIRMEFLYIVLPIIFITSINYEESIGAFRMYMIRPYKKRDFIISKWIALTITTFILIIMTFLISTIFGYIFMPAASAVKFYNISHEFSAVQALLYTLAFFITQFIISLSILALASVIGTIIDNSIISILVVIAVTVVLGFYTKTFEFLDYIIKYGFYVLSGTAPISFYVCFLGIFIGGLAASILLWQKKDYLL